MIEISTVDEYLARHLKAAEWNALEPDRKDAAVKMASDDVCCFLGTGQVDACRVFQVCAVCEQAVYLAVNYDRIADGREVTSEKIDGIGSRSYRDGRNAALSPRALAFLKRETGSAIISRG